MRRQFTGYLWGVLAIVLVVGMALSPNARMVSHDVIALAQIVAEHHAEIQEHGHAHEDVVDVMHAYHGHVHSVADHDHNIAFLPTRALPGVLEPELTNWALAIKAMPDRREFGLDRPPRA